MATASDLAGELLALLKRQSVFHGDFTLTSGAKSSFYIDCRLTTLDARGAWLVGQVVRQAIRGEEAARGVRVSSVGGLTMGADPIAVAVAIASHCAGDQPPLQAFVVRKQPKAHGQGRQIEGNFRSGDTIAVLEDVITRGDSTLQAIEAVTREGGQVAFAVALVDRQEGGRERLAALGYSVLALFTKEQLLAKD